MNYEKKYKEALEKARAINNGKDVDVKAGTTTCEYIFPELKESEDEKVRKEIIDFLKLPHPQFVGKRDHEKWIAWLEKQGQKDILEDVILDGNEDGLIAETIRFKKEKQSEQEPADKVEPKFKVGDWIINPRTGLIKHIKNVLLCDNNGNYEFESSSMSINSVDNSFHLWTIQDAKDGDVLANDNEIVIFKENNFNQKDLSGCMFVHCSLHNKKGYWYTIGGINPSNYVPTTKEQRDLLFRKMKEAGYEWDIEKRELKKINSYCQENCKGFQETGKCFADGECKAKREAEQELTDLGEFINELSKQFPDISFAKLSRIVVRVTKWAKSDDEEKSRVQPNEEEIEKAAQEWDSKANFNPFYMIMDSGKPTGVKQSITTHKESFKAGVNWILKSLKGRVQPQWKPSNKQMNALWCNCSPDSVLLSLYDDLKKLKEGKV